MSNEKNALMTMTNDGDITNMEQKTAMIQEAIKGGLLPKRYTNVGMVLAAMQYSKEIGLGGNLVSLKQIAVVNGTPTIYGDLPLGICFKSGKLEYIKEYFLDKEQKVICEENKNMFASAEIAVCKVKRTDDSEPCTCYFSMTDAAKAGLAGRDTWAKYPRIMLKYRARSEALKSKFPDFLNGVGIGEYDFDQRNESDVPAQKFNGPSIDINAIVLGDTEKKEEAKEEPKEDVKTAGPAIKAFVDGTAKKNPQEDFGPL